MIKIKMLMVFALTLIMGAVSFADSHIPTEGSLPSNPEPGQCFVHVFHPAEYDKVVQQIVIKEAYTYYEITPPVFKEVQKEIPVADSYVGYFAEPPVFGSERVKIEIFPSDPVWNVTCCKKKHHHTDKCKTPCSSGYNTADAKEVGDSLTKEKGKHHHHKHKGPCEQACFDYVKPKFKVVVVQTTIENGKVFPVPVPFEVEQYTYTETVADGSYEAITVPEETMDVYVYELLHPGYMEWKEGTCKDKPYQCRGDHLQSALQKAKYYNGRIDGIVGPKTISAMNKFQADNNLEITTVVNKVTAEALGIKSSS